MAERVEERKEFLTKKKLGIFALLILLLLSSMAYVTMQWVEAKEIREHLDLGNKYYAEAQYEEAIIEYEKVLELDEKNVEARIGLVKSYRALNKVAEARKVLIAGIQIVPKEPRFYSNLVDIYLAEGNVLEAVKILDEGLSTSKDDSLIKKRTEISNNLELTVDRTLLQVDETANLQVVYHSSVINDAEDKQEAGSEQGAGSGQEAGSEQTVPVNDSDGSEAVEEEPSNEQGSSDSGNSDSEHSGEKTTNVSATWSLSTKGPGSLANEKGEANVFSAKQPGIVRVTAKVGSISKDATLEVKDHVLREIKVQTSTSAAKPSEVVQLTAKGFDAKGEEIEINPAWSIKSGAGTLSEDTGSTNTFTTEEEGTTEIVVSQDKIEASVTIAVEKKQFVLTKISNGQGTIQSNPNGKEFTDGDVITLTATPAQGWEFSHWAGDASGTDSKVTVKMDQNKTVEAVFTKIPEYTISSSVEGNGSIARSPSDSKYLKGTTVTLEATPDEGWKFERWEGDVSATNPKVTLTMDGNKAVRAIFSRIQESYQLTTEVTGEGSIDRTPNTAAYAEGTEVRLTATPREGWKFDHWTGDATGTQSTVTVTMDGEKTVKAIFVKASQAPVETYTLQTLVEGEGTVQAQPAQDKYEAGTTVQLTATPKEGWKFDHWTGDVTGTQSTVTVTMDGEKTVKAIFVEAPESYTLQTSVEGEGTVQPQPAQDSYEAGATVQLTAAPKEGWSFKEWSGDASGETNPLSVHMDSNKQIKAVFVEHGTVKGIVKNARTGTPAPSIAIKARKGEGAETGNAAAETTTNSAGQYELRLAPGKYTLELSGNGYNKKYELVEVQSAATNEQDINIMPTSDGLTEFSVVLSWGERPADLDAHLKGPLANGTGRFHIYYGQRSYTENGVTYAQLDTDDTDGKGPETITAFKQVAGVYRYYVYNFRGDAPLAGSGAKVELYKNGNLYRTFLVPAGGTERYWHVFEIENGQLRTINILANNEME